LAITAYGLVLVSVAAGLLPPTALVCVLSLPLLRVGKVPPGVPYLQVYARRTQRAFLHTALFTLLLAAGAAL
jgi:hypothetical protein